MNLHALTHVGAVLDNLQQETGAEAPLDSRVIRTGIAEIDEAVFGLRRGQLTVLAARPGMGKTMLAIRIALNVARAYDQPALYFSLDASADRIATQLVCGQGRCSDATGSDATDAQSLIRKLPLFIDDTPALSAKKISYRVLDFDGESNAGSLGLVVIDSLQGISPTFTPDASGKAHGKVMRALRDIAHVNDVPVLLLSGLSRRIEKRKLKEPLLSDLPCPSVAAYADQTWLLYRKDYYRPDIRHKGHKSIADLTISNRRKSSGCVRMQFEDVFCQG